MLDGSLVLPVEIETGDGPVTQRYYVPSPRDCMSCHTKQEGFVLGTNTRQMNLELFVGDVQEDQLAMLNRLEVFTEPLPGASEDLEKFPVWGFGNFPRSERGPRNTLQPPQENIPERARAWLEVNCAMCHRPEGIAPHQRDMRFHIGLDAMNLIGKAPSHGQLGPPDVELIRAGEPHRSELFFRIGRRGPRQMPPLASNRVDPRGLHVLERWISELDSERDSGDRDRESASESDTGQ